MNKDQVLDLLGEVRDRLKLIDNSLNSLYWTMKDEHVVYKTFVHHVQTTDVEFAVEDLDRVIRIIGGAK